MKKTRRSFVVFAFASLFAAFQAQAVLYVAPTLKPHEVAAYFQNLVNNHPGFSQIAANTNRFVGAATHEQGLLPKLEAFPGFLAMAEAKPELQTLTFEIAGEDFREYKLTPQAFEQRKQELLAFLDKPRATRQQHYYEHYLANEIAQRTREIFTTLQGKDPRGMITGLINSLPGPSRAEFFKLGQPSLQIAALEKSAALTNESISKNFKTEFFGLAANQANRETLIPLIKNYLDLEKEATLGIRLLGFSANSTNGARRTARPWANDLESLKRYIQNERDQEALNPDAEALSVTFTNYFQNNEAMAPVFNRIAKAKEKQDFVVESKEKEAKAFQIVEQPPFVGIYRSAISNDCSSTASWAFPYSPMEREYFVYLPNGKFVAHVGATIVTLNGVRTLYAHDVKGQQLSPQVGNLVLHALHLGVKQLGADQISLATAAQTDSTNNSPEMKQVIAARRGKVYPQVYPDAEIRTGLLGVQPASGLGYDAPNQQGHLFVPDPEILKQLKAVKVTFQDSHDFIALTRPTPKLTDKEVENALKQYYSKEGATLVELFPRKVAQQHEFKAIVDAIENSKQLSLHAYAQELESILRPYEMGSQEWISKRARLLLPGLERCNDASGANAFWQDLWITSKRRLLAAGEIEKLLPVFSTHNDSASILINDKTFIEGVSKLNPKGDHERALLGALLSQGAKLSWLKDDRLKLSLQLESTEPIKVLEAAEHMVKAKHTDLVTEKALHQISELLDNEKAEDLGPSARAIKLLSHFEIKDPATLKNILGSAKDEEDPEFRFLAAAIVAKAGVVHRKVVQALESEKEEFVQLPKALRERGEQALKFIKAKHAEAYKTALAELAMKRTQLAKKHGK